LSLFVSIAELGLVLFQQEASVLSPMNLDFPEERNSEKWHKLLVISFVTVGFIILFLSLKCFYYQALSILLL